MNTSSLDIKNWRQTAGDRQEWNSFQGAAKSLQGLITDLCDIAILIAVRMSKASERASKRRAGVAAIRHPGQRVVVPVSEAGLEGGAESGEGLTARRRGGGPWWGAEGAPGGGTAPQHSGERVGRSGLGHLKQLP